MCLLVGILTVAGSEFASGMANADCASSLDVYSSNGVPLWQVCCLVGMKDDLVNKIEGLSGVEQVFHTALPEWVYFQAHMHDSLQDWLAHLLAIQTFCNKPIMEPVPTNDACLLEIGWEQPVYLFDIGDWVTLQIGVYEDDLGCVIGRYTWGYDIIIIPQFPKDSTMHHCDTTIPVGNYAELLPLSPKAIASENVPIQDGFQLLELSNKTLVHAENMDSNNLENFIWPPSLVKTSWTIRCGNAPCPSNGTVKGIQHTTIEIKTEGLGDYVEVFTGEHKSWSGYMQGVHNPVLIDVLQGAASKGVGVPWVGLHALVLPAIKKSKKHPLNSMATMLHMHIDQANDHKGKIRTVLDVNIDQTLDSGLRLDYGEVVEEMPTMPLHEGPSKDHGTGNTWDVTVPEPPDPRTLHWSMDTWLAQHQLRVNIEGKSQPQKVLLELSGAQCNMKIMFQATLTNVLHLADITPVKPTGPHVGKYVCGIHYVQGTKPILWTVHQIMLVQDEHDSLVGEAFNIPNCDLCQVADSQETLDVNFHNTFQWLSDQNETKCAAAVWDFVFSLLSSLYCCVLDKLSFFISITPSSWHQNPPSLTIKKIIAQYIPKMTYGKVWEHGTPAPKDDSDLLSWVEAKGAELEKAFPNFYKLLDPKRLDDARKKFAAKCWNAKNNKKECLHKQFFDVYFALPFIPTSNNSHPTAMLALSNVHTLTGGKGMTVISLLDPVPPPSGHDLFIEANKAKINAAVKAECDECGLGNRHHATLFQSKCKEFYDSIRDEEKQKWSK
ncbi:hypothetical protein IW262DRAFT_1302761 [Armillaria fumosa]|nr:hypothetical protein IW262DRAFT_1302761 [Armillaria fumosa]